MGYEAAYKTPSRNESDGTVRQQGKTVPGYASAPFAKGRERDGKCLGYEKTSFGHMAALIDCL